MAKHCLGQQQVERPGHLERLLRTGDDVHGQPEPFDKSGVVGVQHDSRIRRIRGAAGQKRRIGTFQNGAREALRSLNGTQMFPGRRFHDHVVIVDPPDGVRDREDRDDRGRPGDHCVDHRVDDLPRDERSGGVVYEHHIAIRRSGRQGEGDGVTTACAAGNHHWIGARKLTGQIRPDLIFESLGHRNDDCLDPRGGQQGSQSMCEKGRSG